jgi:hypothetical protein
MASGVLFDDEPSLVGAGEVEALLDFAAFIASFPFS